MTCGLIVVNYGDPHQLVATLADHAAQMPVFVVDNYSTPKHRQASAALAAASGWEFVPQSRNLGFGAGANRGLAAARERGCDSFVLVNPDARITPEVAEALSQATRQAARPTLVAPLLLRPDGSVWAEGSVLNFADGRLSRAQGAPPDWLSGAVLALDRRVLALVGGFDERFFLYWEDLDLSYRLRQLGGSLLVRRDLTGTHAEGGTQGVGLQCAGQAKSSLYYRYMIANRLLFASLHLDRAGQRAWRRATLGVAKDVLLQGGRRQFLHPLAPLTAACLGVRDGLRFLRAAPEIGTH